MKARATSSESNLGKVRVLLLCPGFPWQFGAYQNQQNLLGLELISRGFEVYWNSCFRELASADTYDVDEVVRVENSNRQSPPKGSQIDAARLFTYIGVQLPPAYKNLGRGVLASAVNQQIKRHNIDAIICLLDANQIMMDEPFAAYSIMWFPSHFSTLVPTQNGALIEFDTVATLAPTHAEMLRDPEYKLKQVETIPHIIERPSDLTTASKKMLRKKYRIPLNAFVVLVNCGNYEVFNRKSLDTAMIAFKALRDAVPEAFLYLKVISTQEILVSEGHSRNANVRDESIPIELVLKVLKVPMESYVLQAQILEANAAWELMMCADVLLMPSKTEGFGLPMVEAQLLGVPVVTTKFGAMQDYTIYGVSVPPSQPIFMQAGLAVMPDVYGVIDALKLIHAGGLDGENSNKSKAINFINSEMSSKAVGSKFENLIREGVSKKTVELLFQRKKSIPEGDYGDDAEDWYYSLPYQHPNRFKILRELPKTQVSRWILLWSNISTLDHKALAQMKDGGWPQLPATEGDIIFFLTVRPDGSVFPRDIDLQKGHIDPDGIVMMRADRFMAADKLMTKQTGTPPSAFEAMRSVLQGKSPIERPSVIKVFHNVLATVKKSEIKKRLELEQTFFL